jgi:hypothetical protein
MNFAEVANFGEVSFLAITFNVIPFFIYKNTANIPIN